MKLLKIIIITTFLISLFNCSSKDKGEPTVEKDYLLAMKSLKGKSYSEAADLFEKIDEDYPFSKWAKKAQTMAVYARYKSEEYDQLIQIVDDFTRLNPASQYNSYMLYMKGLSYYKKIPTITRSQDDTQLASYTFRELIARYPETSHALDAKTKLEFIDEHIAGYYMSIGRNEMNMGNYVGAIGNFQKVISRYRYTNQVVESYFRLFEIYSKIGILKEANIAKNILLSQYPDSYWTQKLN